MKRLVPILLILLFASYAISQKIPKQEWDNMPCKRAFFTITIDDSLGGIDSCQHDWCYDEYVKIVDLLYRGENFFGSRWRICRKCFRREFVSEYLAQTEIETEYEYLLKKAKEKSCGD